MIMKKNQVDLGVSHQADVTWFAGMAMQSMIAKQGIPESKSAREEIALWAFRMGQAMDRIGHQLLDAGLNDTEPEC